MLLNRKRAGLALTLACFLAPTLWAQPYFYSVVNSASYSKDAIAPGSIFVASGYGVGPSQLLQAASYPLPYELGGTSIKVTVGSSTLACPMFYTSATQVAAILPSGTPPGDAVLTPSYKGVMGFSSHIVVSSSAFGIYSADSSGLGPGSITGVGYDLKRLQNAARPGETVILWGTGLGAISGSDIDIPSNGKQFSGVEAFVGTSAAKVSYAGRSGCCAGLDQIAVEIPASVFGCYVPVAVRSGGLVSNFVTLAIDPAGTSCASPPPGPPAAALIRALGGEELKLGVIAIGPTLVLDGAGFQFASASATRLFELLHARVSEDDARSLIGAYRARDLRLMEQALRKFNLSRAQITPRFLRSLRAAAGIDQQGAVAAFGTSSGLSGFASALGPHLPPPGNCIVTKEPRIAEHGVHTHFLDAGRTLNFSGPAGQRTMTLVRGQYQLSLGSGYVDANVTPGTYAVSGTGGADIPQFTASLSVTGGIAWTNKHSIASIDRRQPLTVTWIGASVPGYILIGGSVHTIGENTTLVCVEDSAKGAFTIPAFVLAALPAAEAQYAFFFVTRHPLSSSVSIPGLDLAYFVNASSDYASIEVR